jgi:hypothetical protein
LLGPRIRQPAGGKKAGRAEDFAAAPDATPMDAKLLNHEISPRVKFAGGAVRFVFMCLLLVLIVRVARPQSETIWTAWETTGDLVRLVLGLAACGWIVVHLFSPPRDVSAYRTWLYLGLVAVPFAIICAVLVW